MYQPIQLKNTTTVPARNSVNRSPLWRGKLLILVPLAVAVMITTASAQRVRQLNEPPAADWRRSFPSGALLELLYTPTPPEGFRLLGTTTIKYELYGLTYSTTAFLYQKK